MDELRNFEEAFKTYYSEINLDEIKFDEKEIEDLRKDFEAKGKTNLDEKIFQETLYMKKVIEIRALNLKKARDEFFKSKLSLLISDKEMDELKLVFDVSIDSIAKIDVIDLSKDNLYKRFADLQERLDSRMTNISISYATKLFEEVKNSNDYATYASAQQTIEKANLPKEAVDVFNSLITEYTKKDKTTEEKTEEENSTNINEINAEQQAIEDNEGSLENNNIDSNEIFTENSNGNNREYVEGLASRMRQVDVNGDVKYGAEINKHINEYNVDIENERIDRLMNLKEKDGKLSLIDAMELRTLIEKRELRRKKEINNSLINKAGDVLLKDTNRKLDKVLEKQEKEEQKVNITNSYFARKKLVRLNKQVNKLYKKQGKLVSFQINNAMLSRNISEKLLTAHAIGNSVTKKFVSVKNKVMEKIHSNSDLNIILEDEPIILNVESLDSQINQGRAI